MAPSNEHIAAAVATEQIFLRSLCAVLIEREISRAPDPNAALREIVERTQLAIDFYQIDRPTSQAAMDQDKEMARLLTEGVAAIAESLLKSRK